MFSGPEAQNFKKKPAVLQNKFDPYHQGDQLNSAVRGFASATTF